MLPGEAIRESSEVSVVAGRWHGKEGRCDPVWMREREGGWVV